MNRRTTHGPPLRTVYVIAGPEAQKARYYDENRGMVRPNLVFVDSEGAVVFATNEAGLKGDRLDPTRHLAVVWGDSVVFGAGWGWPRFLDRLAPGCQVLNGGIEGDHYANILRRAQEFNAHYPVRLNIVMLGWHPFILPAQKREGGGLSFAKWQGGRRHKKALGMYPGNRSVRSDLTRFLQSTPNTVVLTMPTALNARIVDHDLSSFLVEGDDRNAFRFVGNTRYQFAGQRPGFEHIIERNALAREVCEKLGIRLIDLFAAFDTEHVHDFREHFIDLIHPRPTAYPVLAQRVYEGIKDLLT